ncbi:MAG: T9SS type A sorting domain-containing protein [Bacteroidetes bacterium]|nr:T9SS type A sorting domain-containing protein [Bacteroidota bacterium]
MRQIIWMILCLPLSVYAQDFESSNLPILVVDTQGEEIPDEPKIDVLFGIIYNGPGVINHLDDPFNEYDGWAGIEKRGSTSQTIFPKVGYGLETRFADGSNNNVSLLGMPEENDWVLHGPYSDKTLIRNVLAYEMAGKIMAWAPRTRFCELVINGEYMGLYVLLERVKRDNDRIDIATLNPDDISGDQLTGGYVIKLDKETGSVSDGWPSLYKPIPGQDQTIFFQYHEPQADEIQPAQQGYIQQFMDAFEQNLQSADFADPEEGYAQFIDDSTFIDYLIINEIARNVDGYRLSTFLYKDRDSTDSRLKMGPVWDFNIAFGNANYCLGESTTGFAFDFNDVCSGDFWLIPFWWDRLMEDPDFNCQLYARWNDLRSGMFSDTEILELVDSLTTVIGDAAGRNFERWPVLGEAIWPNYYVGQTYENEIVYLRNWLVNRMAFLDDAFGTLCTSTLTPLPNPPAVRVAPNPTSDETVAFYFNINTSTQMYLRIYDISGRLVHDQLQTFDTPGNKIMEWDPKVPAGTYFYQIYRNGDPFYSGRLIRI